MGNLLKFKRSSQYYLDMSDKYADEGNYISAISNLRYGLRFSENREDTEELLLTMAEKYAEMGRFDDSNEVFFDLLSKDMAKSDCYFGLAQNYYCLENQELSAYYLGLLSDAEEELSLDDLTNVFDGLESVADLGLTQKSAYRIVYPVSEDEQEKARGLMALGQVDEAIAILSRVSEKDALYVSALSDLTMCYMLKEEYDTALKYSLMARAKDGENLSTLCNLAVLYKLKKDFVNADQCIQEILAQNVKDGLEASRIASTMCEFDRHAEAEKYLKIALSEKKYLDTFLLLLGLTQYNQQKFDEASATFDKMLKISPRSSIAKYYMRMTKNAILDKENGKEEFKALAYLPQIPYIEIVQRFKFLEKMADELDFTPLEDENSQAYEDFWWLMETTESGLQLYFVEGLIESEIANKVEILQRLLLLNQVSRQVKSKAYYGLMQEFADKICLVDGGRFDEIKCFYPKRYKKMPNVLRDAFCMATSMLVFFAKEELPAIRRAADDVYLLMSQNDVKLRSVKAMAILLMMKTKQRVFGKDILCKIMGVSKATLKKYEQLLK